MAIRLTGKPVLESPNKIKCTLNNPLQIAADLRTSCCFWNLVETTVQKLSGNKSGVLDRQELQAMHKCIKIINNHDPKSRDYSSFDIFNIVFPEIYSLITYFHHGCEHNIILKEQKLANQSILFPLTSIASRWTDSKDEQVDKTWKAFIEQVNLIGHIYFTFYCCLGISHKKPFSTYLQDLDVISPLRTLWHRYEEASAELEHRLKNLIETHPDEYFIHFAETLYSMLKVPNKWEELNQSNLPPTFYRLCSLRKLLFDTSWRHLYVNFNSRNNQTYPFAHKSSPEGDSEFSFRIRSLVSHDTAKMDQLFHTLGEKLGELHVKIQQTEKNPSLQHELLQKIAGTQLILQKYVEHSFEKDEQLLNAITAGLLTLPEISKYLKWKKWIEGVINTLMGLFYEVSPMYLTNLHNKDLEQLIIHTLLEANELRAILAEKHGGFSLFELLAQDMSYDFRFHYGMSIESEKISEISESPHLAATENSLDPKLLPSANLDESQEKKTDAPSLTNVEMLTQKITTLLLEKTVSLEDIYSLLQQLQADLNSAPLQSPHARNHEVKKMTYEIHSHAFLCLKNLLDAIQAYKSGKFKKQGHHLSLHNAIISAYLAIEKKQNLDEYSKNGTHQANHDFSQAPVLAELSEEAQQLLRESTKGTLAPRFPCSYSHALPTALKPFYDPEKSIREKIEISVRVAKMMLEIISTSSTHDQIKIAFNHQLPTYLQNVLPEASKKPPTQKLPKSVILHPDIKVELARLKTITEHARWREKSAIQQIELYIDLLEESEIFRTSHENTTHLFEKTRNLFLLPKLYEELCLFVFNTYKKEVKNLHDFNEVIDELQALGFILPHLIKEALLNMNIGNRMHYLFTAHSGQKPSILVNLFKQETQNLLNQDGFQRKEKMLEGTERGLDAELQKLAESHQRLLTYLPELLSNISATVIRLQEETASRTTIYTSTSS